MSKSEAFLIISQIYCVDGFFWCNSCDRQLVRDGVKCPVCGTKNNPKKIRYD